MVNIEYDVAELSVNASNFSKLGSGLPLETTFNQSETAWWVWLIIALVLAAVIAVVIAVSVIFTRKPKPKKEI